MYKITKSDSGLSDGALKRNVETKQRQFEIGTHTRKAEARTFLIHLIYTSNLLLH